MDRRGNWAADEVEEMIESIKEREILCLPEGKKVRSLDVFKVVANDLRAKGMYRTPEQIRTKLRILRKDYFKALRSGSKSEYRACEFFTSLHDLFTDAHRKMEARKRRLQRRQQQQQQQLRVLTDNPSNGSYQPSSHRDEYPGVLQEHRTKKRTSTTTSSATIKSSRSSSVISSRMLNEEAICVDQSASFAVPTVPNDTGGGPGGTPDGSVCGKQRPEPLPDKYHLKLNEYLPNLNNSLANLCK
ncbi:uncharacterized protein LOC125958167 [Anopheles darlingi]|nr:uncharacterized protein LOC125958167 [Anopheles darlingi]